MNARSCSVLLLGSGQSASPRGGLPAATKGQDIMALVKCKQCGNENAKDAKVCPKCGTSLKMGMGKKILIGFGVLFLLAAIGRASNKGESSTRTVTAGAAPDTPAAQAATEAPLTYVKESCLKLANTFGTGSKLSELQKEELWKQYKDENFQWELEISDVRSGMLSGFRVQAKCSPESPSIVSDVQISYDNDAKSLVMQLQKGSVYKLRGKLTHTSTLLGMMADGIP